MSPLTRWIHRLVGFIAAAMPPGSAEVPKEFARSTAPSAGASFAHVFASSLFVAGAFLYICNKKGTGDEETREPSLQSCPDSASWVHRGQLRVAVGLCAGRHWSARAEERSQRIGNRNGRRRHRQGPQESDSRRGNGYGW